MKNIAIFASGNGTNCENIIRYFENSETVCVALVVCNNKSAQVIKRAEKFGVPVEIVNKEGFKDSSRVLPLLAGHNISYIILAGFMLLLPDYLTEAYKDRIVNIHPSLLPKYGGKGMYGDNVHKAVKENGEKDSGITIHLVNNEYDKGQILKQYTTPLSPEDSADDIARKVHALEYEHYPEVIEQLLSR